MSIRTSVLHLLNGEQYSGLERVVDHLLAAAPAHGFRFELVCLKPGAMRKRLKSTCGSIHDCPMHSRLDLSVWRETVRIAKESDCALVHSHTVRSALVARRVQQAADLPWVHHVHSPALNESERRGMNLLNFLAEASVMRYADSVVTVSQALAEYVTRWYRVADDRVTVVPNGVSSEPAHSVAPSATGRRTVITVGLFRPRKGIEYLVDAARLLVDDGHDLRVRFVGEFADRTYEIAIRKRARRLCLADRVEFVGFVGDVRPEMWACDVFTLPSLYGEGMPLALLEAMAGARPIVASDIPGVREPLVDGAAVLVPPASSVSLADGIGRLLADPGSAKALGAAARRRQQERYSVESMQSAVFAGYRQLLANHPYGISRVGRP